MIKAKQSPEMPDEEDDIPLDLILKEEQIEVINNGPATAEDLQAKKGKLQSRKISLKYFPFFPPRCPWWPDGSKTCFLVDDTSNELCAFESCGLCQVGVNLGDAKLLGCLHTFCNECLEKSEMQRINPDGTSTKVLCPVCRCLTPRTLLTENHFVPVSVLNGHHSQ